VRFSIKFLLPSLLAAVLISACGSSSGSTSSSPQPASSSSGVAASAATVKSASNSKLGGTVLVNAKGLTLYRLSGEHAGKFICTTSACAQLWHPLTLASGSKPAGSISSLGTVKRPDGIEQVTYKGMPLYTFTHDTGPGQANGQGFKDVGTWMAVETSGSATSSTAAATSTSASSSPSTSSSGGGSYGY
jgi:predicted lipoprotein with Yx(FWY)xxD motif